MRKSKSDKCHNEAWKDSNNLMFAGCYGIPSHTIVERPARVSALSNDKLTRSLVRILTIVVKQVSPQVVHLVDPQHADTTAKAPE